MGMTTGMRVTVFGCGYLGATHAACLAELGHEVLGVDVDENKIATLTSGELPFYEPGLVDVLRRNLASGRLRFTTDYDDAAAFADVHFLGVGTPQKKGEYAADLRHVYSMVEDLVPRLRGDHLIIGKSTVPVGTATELQRRADAAAPDGTWVEVAWNPEFLREGYAVKDTLHPDRIVLGFAGENSTAEARVRVLYAQLLDEQIPFLVHRSGDRRDWSRFRPTPFWPRRSPLSMRSRGLRGCGGRRYELADAIGHDDRIGRKFFNAGLGFGGGCLPKDIRAFMARAGELGADQALSFLREVDTINMRRRTRWLNSPPRLWGFVLGHRLAVLGAAFKPEVRRRP